MKLAVRETVIETERRGQLDADHQRRFHAGLAHRRRGRRVHSCGSSKMDAPAPPRPAPRPSSSSDRPAYGPTTRFSVKDVSPARERGERLGGCYGRSTGGAVEPVGPATIAFMQSTESRYVPVVNIIAGTVAGVFLSKLVTTNLGSWSYLVFTLATLGTFSLVRDGWSTFQRWRVQRGLKIAYEKVALILKPEISPATSTS